MTKAFQQGAPAATKATPPRSSRQDITQDESASWQKDTCENGLIEELGPEMRTTDHFDALERYYRLYNDREFSRIHPLLADDVTSFRPEMAGRRLLEPMTLPRDQFVAQLGSCRDLFGTITMRSCDETTKTITAMVEFGAGYTAANTVIFLGSLISSTFVYRRDGEQRIREAIA